VGKDCNLGSSFCDRDDRKGFYSHNGTTELPPTVRLNQGDVVECKVDKQNGMYSFWRREEQLWGGCIIPDGPFVFAVMLAIVDQSVQICQ